MSSTLFFCVHTGYQMILKWCQVLSQPIRGFLGWCVTWPKSLDRIHCVHWINPSFPVYTLQMYNLYHCNCHQHPFAIFVAGTKTLYKHQTYKEPWLSIVQQLFCNISCIAMTYEWTCCFDPHLSKLRAGERTTHSPHHGRCFDLLPQRCRSNTFGEAVAGKEFEPLKTSCNRLEIVISGAAATFSKRFANQVRCRSSPSAATSILVRNACDACPVSAQHWYALVICWDNDVKYLRWLSP